MADEFLERRSIGGGPGASGLVGGTGGDEFAIVGEFDTGDGTLVACKGLFKLVGLGHGGVVIGFFR